MNFHVQSIIKNALIVPTIQLFPKNLWCVELGQLLGPYFTVSFPLTKRLKRFEVKTETSLAVYLHWQNRLDLGKIKLIDCQWNYLWVVRSTDKLKHFSPNATYPRLSFIPKSSFSSPVQISV